ncbi:glycosyltransferase family 2 protein [Tropicibacter oceani]|uniref:Glycosyltransferase family 2 protein n=1 Tax=Tropicibacter oceani TaxID=3058420 RepID=A0ABY8QEM5_9RHOB|nr:glycosyltransferase family 2 protein [Tropicibacter oceani]WGW03064.1 glycosyltransferase family 2 protein [Tropicibacter oceani]
MKRIFLHIGPDGPHSDRMQRILDAKRGQLARKGVLYPRSPGARNHTRLFMAVSEPGNVDSLRFNRGFTDPEKQAALRADVMRALKDEAAASEAETLILSCHQFGSGLTERGELIRLRDLLAPICPDITVVAHLDDPARMLVRRYAGQLFEGRSAPLDLELGLLDAADFRAAALATRPDIDPPSGRFAEVQGANFWLDFKGLHDAWADVFGTVQLRSLDLERLYSDKGTEEIRESFAIDKRIGKAEAEPMPDLPPAAWMARCRQFNDTLLRLLDRRDMILPRPLWRKLLGDIKVQGPAIAPGSLAAVSDRFRKDLQDLSKAHPGLAMKHLKPDAPCPPWTEADPLFGFRATQYLAAMDWRLKQATKQARAAQAPDPVETARIDDILSPAARSLLPPRAKQSFAHIRSSIFAPHNRLGQIDEEQLAAAYTPAAPRALPGGSTGRVIVGCMKNEAPYILEWIAYHRAIGVDSFLIYTNDCDDGTDALLDRLQDMGVLQHRDNSHWTGKSPQQFALDAALDEPLVKAADWLIHIDVDEFINVRCGNGTLDDFLQRVPGATNVAMTWRLFGHNGVTRLSDDLVIDQFDSCAPKYCPKPHTVWGFKSMFRNIGAYQKLSCHRPNKLTKGSEGQVKWVNGSGQDMTAEAIRNGWRSSKQSIGYDLIQLNHYALRSAESFLIKRQRGRALHVDRSIGLNYWIRMDWGGNRDVTIKRNIPRVRAEMDRLLQDAPLRQLHQRGLDWHRAKADELHRMPEFQELYQQALDLRLTETERVAYALTLDMDS